jgi:hypothetical protein
MIVLVGKVSIGHGYNIHLVIFQNERTNEISVRLGLPENPEED